MITIKTEKDIAILKEGGKILAYVLKELSVFSQPGINMLDIEKQAAKLIKAKKAQPAFLGYQGYPAILCLSPNEHVVHCAPKNYNLQAGDILSIDCGIKYRGLYTDHAVTIAIGKISKPAQKLIETTREALAVGIAQVKEGNTVGDIGYAIANFVEKRGLNVVKTLVGHGVGYKVHEEPKIPNYGKQKTGPVLKAGMVICIEPMVNIGGSEIDFDHADGWTVTTRDGSLSAHFEHTIVVQKNGSEIITKL